MGHTDEIQLGSFEEKPTLGNHIGGGIPVKGYASGSSTTSADDRDVDWRNGQTRATRTTEDGHPSPPIRIPALSPLFPVSSISLCSYLLVPVTHVLAAHRNRSNIGNAKVAGMAKDLNLVGYQDNIAAAVFFLLYAAAEIPR